MSDNLKWYAIKTVAGKEKSALESLETEIRVNDLEEWVNEIILPTEKVFSIRKGRKVARESLIMPGYLFIECELIGEVPRIIKSTKNIIGFTGDKSNNPQPIRKSEMDRLVYKLDTQEEVDSNKIPYIVGEEVKIMDGAFSTFKGVVKTVNEDSGIIDVSVAIFGRETSVKIDYMKVDKVTD